jgi:hypothetical protein
MDSILPDLSMDVGPLPNYMQLSLQFAIAGTCLMMRIKAFQEGLGVTISLTPAKLWGIDRK